MTDRLAIESAVWALMASGTLAAFKGLLFPQGLAAVALAGVLT